MAQVIRYQILSANDGAITVNLVYDGGNKRITQVECINNDPTDNLWISLIAPDGVSIMGQPTFTAGTLTFDIPASYGAQMVQDSIIGELAPNITYQTKTVPA